VIVRLSGHSTELSGPEALELRKAYLRSIWRRVRKDSVGIDRGRAAPHMTTVLGTVAECGFGAQSRCLPHHSIECGVAEQKCLLGTSSMWYRKVVPSNAKYTRKRQKTDLLIVSCISKRDPRSCGKHLGQVTNLALPFQAEYRRSLREVMTIST
jgi:hypothetical protein